MPATSPIEVLSTESTVTSRGQTTIPGAIRQALGLQAADKLRFSLRADNTVVVSRSETDVQQADPMVTAFLDFIERDATANPVHIRDVSGALVARARELSRGVVLDLEEPLDPDDD